MQKVHKKSINRLQDLKSIVCTNETKSHKEKTIGESSVIAKYEGIS